MNDEADQRKMFGTTLSKVIAEKPKFADPGLWAISILSEVQELISSSYVPWGIEGTSIERARKLINKAKYWIDVQRPDPRK